MDFGLALLTGIVVAILSSAPMGPIAFAIIHGVLTRGKVVGARIGIGGLIVDTLFAFVAIRLFSLFDLEDSPQVFAWINLLSIPVLVFLGLKMIRDRHKSPTEVPTRKGRSDLFLGFSLGISNPVLFGYWLWVATYVTAEGWVANNLFTHIGFTIGVAVGMGLFIWGWVQLLSMATMRATHRFRAVFSLLVGLGFLIFSVFLAVRYVVIYL